MQDCYFLQKSVETQNLNQYGTKGEIIFYFMVTQTGW